MIKNIIVLLILFPAIFFGQELSIEERILNRDYPSIFQAWNEADNLPDEDPLKTIARHDLYFCGLNDLYLEWNSKFTGLGSELKTKGVKKGLKMREKLLELNPHIVIIAELRYRDAPESYLPDEHSWWMYDEEGAVVHGWEEGGFIRMDFRNDEFRNQIALQARLLVESGVVDGIMLDWWNEEEFGDDRHELLKSVRNAIGEDALIILNSNQREIPRSAPLANGIFMECWDSTEPEIEKWETYKSTLIWAEKHMRSPRINCLETWLKEDRSEKHKMRATVTLSLTCSNGYALFSDPNSFPAPDHLHDWYPFYDAKLGKPVDDSKVLEGEALIREFTNGFVVYNPMKNGVVSFNSDLPLEDIVTGDVAKSFVIPDFDGRIFLKK